jgi:pimeloyl-ACP methyl ester carboxylesterase
MEDTWATWIADVLTVVQGLPTPPIIVGHSLGAHLALRVASECPTLVRALVLEDPPLPRVEVPWSREDFAREKEEFLARFDAGDDSEIDRMRIESSWTEPEITAWARCKPLVDRQMIRLEALPTGDWVAVFNRLAVATLLVAPVGSPMAPDPAAINNPLVQIRFVPGVGHCVRRDDPAAYHALVDPFLAAHRPGKV